MMYLACAIRKSSQDTDLERKGWKVTDYAIKLNGNLQLVCEKTYFIDSFVNITRNVGWLLTIWFYDLFLLIVPKHTHAHTHIYTLKYLLGGRSIQGQDSSGGESGVVIQDL